MTYQAQERPLIGIPTWNDSSQYYAGVPLHGINQSYVTALQQMGAAPILIPLRLEESSLRRIFQTLDGLFLTGGGDIAPRLYDRKSRDVLETSDLERDWIELTLASWALEAGMPILGVCRGMQIINVACGGTLHRDLRDHNLDLTKHDFIFPEYQRDRISHQVQVQEDSYLAEVFGATLGVNSMHRQGVADVGGGLRVAATSEDGLPEAIEAVAHAFAVGFQWHPEELIKCDDRHGRIFDDFLGTARDDWRN